MKNSFDERRPSMNTGPMNASNALNATAMTSMDDPYQPSMVQDLL